MLWLLLAAIVSVYLSALLLTRSELKAVPSWILVLAPPIVALAIVVSRASTLRLRTLAVFVGMVLISGSLFYLLFPFMFLVP